MSSLPARGPGHPEHFDVRRFGQQLRDRREALGYSTRQMARIAGVSQAYVVALEGSKSSRDSSGPCPTVEVLVSFAAALRLHPSELLQSSLRRSGPHVLLVTEGAGTVELEAVISQVEGVGMWITAGERTDLGGRWPHIDLHSTDEPGYALDTIAVELRRGLSDLSSQATGRRVGLVFSEPDSVLLGSTEEVLAVEHHWKAMVSRSLWAVDAEPTATLCVYELEVVRRMQDPLEASLDLIRSHDSVWTVSGERTSRGRRAAMRLLQGVRPPERRADEWRLACTQHLDRLTAA